MSLVLDTVQLWWGSQSRWNHSGWMAWQNRKPKNRKASVWSFGTNSLIGTGRESHENYLIHSKGDASMTQLLCCRFHLLKVPAPPNMVTLRRELQTNESWGTNSTYIQVITVSYWIMELYILNSLFFSLTILCFFRKTEQQLYRWGVLFS